MKEKVEAGDDEPLDMLMLLIVGEKGDVFVDSHSSPFMLIIRTALFFLA
jgi:hypothetical protein